MQPSPSGNPFADPPANTAETSAPQSGTPAQPGPSTNAGATEGTTKVTATLERYPEVPVTGYPVQYSGGAFSTAYPQYGSSSSSYPQYPPPVEPSNAPLYSTFEQSAPYQNPAPATPLTCGIGAQWVIFMVGWLLWPMWYIGVIMRYVGHFDPRERSGWLANCIMSIIFTIIWVAILSSKAYHNHNGNSDVICTIDGCIEG